MKVSENVPELKFQVPKAEEMVALFGCDSSFDKLTLTQCYEFEDSHGSKTSVCFGVADQTVSIEISPSVVFRAHALLELKTNADENRLTFFFGGALSELHVNLSVWPNNRLEISGF